MTAGSPHLQLQRLQRLQPLHRTHQPLRPHRWGQRHRRRSAGFTLVELLVAVTIGMGLVLAITLMMMRFESARRSLSTANDASAGGAYASFVLDRMVRSAGSGFAQGWRSGFGCQLLVARGGTQVLPRTSAYPAPFASLPQTLRLAPAVVFAGAGTGGSDVLSVVSGASALGETPLRVLPGSATGTGLRVPATVGLRAKDLVLVMQDANQCMLQQVVDGFAGGADQQLTFGGSYGSSEINNVRLDALGATSQAYLAPLGNLAGNQPVAQFIGIGDNGTLVGYDVLRLDGSDAVVPVADGVADMRVLYGVDSTGSDGVIDTWVSPAATGWTAATLLNGTAASQQNLSRVLALRIGLLLRSSTPERTAVTGTSLVLFDDLGSSLKVTRTLSASEQLLHWRSLEFTVPLRNVMLMR